MDINNNNVCDVGVYENAWKDGAEPFQDRNCNQSYDSGEKTDNATITPEPITQSDCENTINGIWRTGGAFNFCDICFVFVFFRAFLEKK